MEKPQEFSWHDEHVADTSFGNLYRWFEAHKDEEWGEKKQEKIKELILETLGGETYLLVEMVLSAQYVVAFNSDDRMDDDTGVDGILLIFNPETTNEDLVALLGDFDDPAKETTADD